MTTPSVSGPSRAVRDTPGHTTEPGKGLAGAGMSALALLLLVAVPGIIQAQDSRPSITGVWSVVQITAPEGQSTSFGGGDGSLSEEGRRVVGEYRAQFDLEGMEPNAYCVEAGMPTAMFGIARTPLEIRHEPDRVTIITEMVSQVRRIWLDGREPPENYPLSRSGYSIGHWDGDTLVVETALIDEWLFERWPRTNQARFVERFSLRRPEEVALRAENPATLGEDVLVDEMTMIEPRLYDRNPQFSVVYRRIDDSLIFDERCWEGLWWEEMDRRRID